MTTLTDWFEPAVEPSALPAAPVCTAIDPLTGAVPSWRLDEEPIYLEVVRDLGIPGYLLGPAPSSVVAGKVVDPGEDERVVDDVDVDEEYPRDAAATASLSLVHPQPTPVVDEPAAPRRQPARKPRAARKRAAS